MWLNLHLLRPYTNPKNSLGLSLHAPLSCGRAVFATGGGWWWALAPVCVALLCACVRHWQMMVVGACACPRPHSCHLAVRSRSPLVVGAYVCCLWGMVVGACACPHPHSCCLAARSHWWWVLGPVHVASLGAHVRHWWGWCWALAPVCTPRYVLTPVHVASLCGTILACHCGCVCWWGLVRCVWDKTAYH